jgi:hypothetical protein
MSLLHSNELNMLLPDNQCSDADTGSLNKTHLCLLEKEWDQASVILLVSWLAGSMVQMLVQQMELHLAQLWERQWVQECLALGHHMYTHIHRAHTSILSGKRCNSYARLGFHLHILHKCNYQILLLSLVPNSAYLWAQELALEWVAVMALHNTSSILGELAVHILSAILSRPICLPCLEFSRIGQLLQNRYIQSLRSL